MVIFTKHQSDFKTTKVATMSVQVWSVSTHRSYRSSISVSGSFQVSNVDHYCRTISKLGADMESKKFAYNTYCIIF